GGDHGGKTARGAAPPVFHASQPAPMRIIGGRFGGRRLKVPPGLPVRPTTDFAKEALFNILVNRIDFSDSKVLDLFTGTGHIAFEFASRGGRSVTAVDQNLKCVSFVRKTAEQLGMEIGVVRDDVFNFLEKTTHRFDLVFADPPYDLADIARIHALVFERDLLEPDGLLVIEHGQRTDLSQLEGFERMRKYGNVRFSFFSRA